MKWQIVVIDWQKLNPVWYLQGRHFLQEEMHFTTLHGEAPTHKQTKTTTSTPPSSSHQPKNDQKNISTTPHKHHRSSKINMTTRLTHTFDS